MVVLVLRPALRVCCVPRRKPTQTALKQPTTTAAAAAAVAVAPGAEGFAVAGFCPKEFLIEYAMKLLLR